MKNLIQIHSRTKGTTSAAMLLLSLSCCRDKYCREGGWRVRGRTLRTLSFVNSSEVASGEICFWWAVLLMFLLLMTCLQELFFRLVSSDAVLQTQFFRCSSLDAVLQMQFFRSSSSDVVLQTQFFRRSSSEAVLQTQFFRCSSSDAVLQTHSSRFFKLQINSIALELVQSESLRIVLCSMCSG